MSFKFQLYVANSILLLNFCFFFQIEQRYKADGLYIAGYYQANEHLRDNV